jgi:hypothetical protein
MRKVFMATLVAAMVGGLGMAYADDAAKPADQNATADSPQLDKNEMICKRGDVTTGSRFPAPPICHTRMEWEQLQRNARELVNGMAGGTSGPHS